MTPRARPVSYCLEQVAEEFGMEVDDLTGSEQVQPIVSIRNIAMYVVREVTGKSYGTIGKRFDRDPSTTLNNVARVRDQFRKQEWYRRRLTPIVLRLRHELGTGNNPRLSETGQVYGTVQVPIKGAKHSMPPGDGSPEAMN
jgi:hypothetical protein